MAPQTRGVSFPNVVIERDSDTEESSAEEEEEEEQDEDEEEEEDIGDEVQNDAGEASDEERVDEKDEASTSTATKRRREAITISLKKVCKVCKKPGHEAGFRGATYIDCPMKPCFLCKMPGHTTMTCPYRVATEFGVSPAPLKKSRSSLEYVFERQLRHHVPAMKPAFVIPNKVNCAVIRYHSRRVTCLEFHPTKNNILISGDKKGQLGVWDYGKVHERIVYGNIHGCILNNMKFNSSNDGTVYGASSDGTVSSTDLETGISLSLVNLNPNGWQGPNSWRMLYGLDLNSDKGILLAADNFGLLYMIDARSNNVTGKPILIHKKRSKVTGLHCHPLQPDLFLSCGNDHFARIWDIRRLEAGSSIYNLPHKRVVNSAYFSPQSGSKILTTSQDNRIRVWDSIFGDLDSPSREIVHSQDFNRHLTPFRAEWDPKDTSESLLVVGRYISENFNGVALHPIDFIDVTTGQLVAEVMDPNITTITPVNKLHPRDDVLASGSSRSIFIWKPQEKNELKREEVESRIISCGMGQKSRKKKLDDDSDDDDAYFSKSSKKKKSTFFKSKRCQMSNRHNPNLSGQCTPEPDCGGGAIDVQKLNRFNRELLVRRALDTTDQDNFKLLSGIKERLNRVGLEIPKIEVRFENLEITAKVQIGSRALPTLVNYTRDTLEHLLTKLRICKPERHKLTILKNISGVIQPERMTLLLGPPGSGKSTLLMALAGKLQSGLKKSGTITYNGHKFDDFFVQRASAYISQTDSHIAELTVRETLDFAARCQGSSEGFSGYMKDLTHLEKEKNIRPRPEIDAYMKASSVGGKKHSVSTDYILKILGLDVCSDTLVGNDMLRGVSGGQRKRVTTGEMVVGPRKTLFMDEISTGLDSSTTFQIVKCTRNYVHFMEGTVMMALLQPAPETFELFDDLILLSEGYLVYQGPREEVIEFFQSLGFLLPPRKSIADFLQEVTSRKDQAQYWGDRSKPYEFIPVSKIAEEFKNSRYGQKVVSFLSHPYDRSKNHPSTLPKAKYAVPRMELFKACFSRELLLIKRHRALYIFRTCQVAFVGFVTCTMFLRTRLHPTDVKNGELYLSCLFFGLVHMMFNGFSELPLMIFRLPVFYKQRDNLFHPAWAWSLPSFVLRLPYSMVEAIVWSCVVYYTVGFAPEAGRFFRYMFILFSVHQMALGLFRTMAALARDMIIANTFGSAALLIIFLLGGFILPKEMIKPWWVWAFWVSPLSYGQRAISVNEFTARRWMERSAGNTTLGNMILQIHSLPSNGYWYWLGVGVLLGYALFFNITVTAALSFLNPIQKSQTIFPPEEQSATSGQTENGKPNTMSGSDGIKKKGMILPFKPLTLTFHNVNYFVDMPKEMSSQGITETRLQLLSNVSGVFSPGVLTALMGSSGAGKTTLMDVLAGRKTGGYIEGDIRISGYLKEQRTFARISGYVEQSDIHSPQVTVMESLWFSSYLRLPKEVNERQREDFVEEVMQLVELDSLRHALVGLPGNTGLSTEQRKRLTIAVELVANPSIIFMDEPTSGLDARAAAIVMRTVRNTVDTGRTVVCTIHQPSIEIFEAFDELLLMKRGGRMIYGGKLGEKSQTMINYFQGIRGVPSIPDGYNPATWMLEISSPAVEERIQQDFAVVYQNSQQYRDVEASIQNLSIPPQNSEPLRFNSIYSKDEFSQFRICLSKQNLVYWRSPAYNAVRMFFTTISAIIIGTVFWDVGSKRDSSANLMVVMGALYASVMFLGVNNSSSVQPVVAIERTVFYREKAAGMYSPLPFAFAQGIVEIPYILAQTIVYGIITYFMIKFERTAGKFFMYLLFMFLTFTYFTFYGMMVVGLTPNQSFASVVASLFYSLWNLLSGFLVPKPSIPVWWIWFYYICPMAWTLRGIITSQLGDVETIIRGQDFEGSVKDFINVHYGFESGMLGVSVAVLVAFSLLFFGVFAISVKVLNFQRR